MVSGLEESAFSHQNKSINHSFPATHAIHELGGWFIRLSNCDDTKVLHEEGQ